MNVQQGPGDATQQTLINLVLETRDMAASLKVDMARLGEKIDSVKETVSANRRHSDAQQSTLKQELEKEHEASEKAIKDLDKSVDEALEKLERRVRSLENWRWLQTGLAGAGGGTVVVIAQGLITAAGGG